MSYRKQQEYRKHGGKCGKRRRRSRKTDVRLPAVIMGTILILILCGRGILTGGIGEITGQAVDSRCYPELQQMMDDCRAAGFAPLICASYRTMEKQEALFEDKEARLIREGCPENEVEAEAAKVVAYPGTSEHQYGFVLRYPTDKSDITGIIYEPWHYRYVGKEAAAEMYENKLCLEEYLGIN